MTIGRYTDAHGRQRIELLSDRHGRICTFEPHEFDEVLYTAVMAIEPRSDLLGTEKQVSWAIDLRAEAKQRIALIVARGSMALSQKLDAEAGVMDEEKLLSVRAMLIDAVSKLLTNPHAKYWIDGRNRGYRQDLLNLLGNTMDSYATDILWP